MTQQRAFTLAEVLITLAIIGVVGAFLATTFMPMLQQDKHVEHKIIGTADNIVKQFQLIESQQGLIPASLTPIRVVSTTLKYRSAQPVVAATAIPSGCQTQLPATKYLLTEPGKTVYVSNAWVNDVTHVCVHQNGQTADRLIERVTGNSRLALSTTESNVKSSGTVRGVSQTVSTLNFPTFTTNNIKPDSDVQIKITYEAAALRPAVVNVTFNGTTQTVSVGTAGQTLLFRNLKDGIYALNIAGADTVSVNDVISVTDRTTKSYALSVRMEYDRSVHDTGAGGIYMSVSHLLDKAWNIGARNVYYAIANGISGSWFHGSWSAFTYDKETNKGSAGTVALVSGYYTLNTITYGNDVFQMGYFIGSDNKVYKYTFVETPLKIDLTGKDASVNGDDAFLLDSDGFAADDLQPLQTSGGLNINEAWLVYDRENNGVWQNNTLDNDDLFGDHLGKQPNGYVDFMNTFKHELKTDGQNIYVELNDSPLEQFKIWCLRLMGNKQPFASSDLKLLTIGRTQVPARDYIKRFYVNYRNVKEFDPQHHNAVFQRAKVQFKDGHEADSVDQYFVFEKPIIVAASEEEIEALKKSGKFASLSKRPTNNTPAKTH